MNEHQFVAAEREIRAAWASSVRAIAALSIRIAKLEKTNARA